MLAYVPYITFPEIDLGPVHLHTFGLFVALGMLAGILAAVDHTHRKGIPREEIYKLGYRFVIWGVIGARIAWDVSHASQIHSPLDVIAVWQGGLTFTGGFIAAAIASIPILRRMTKAERWYTADGVALGLAVGIAIGRIGCYSVGEHLGHETTFFLGVKYLGGVTREGPLILNHVYHNTALYEFIHLVVLSGILWWLLYKRNARPGVAIGLFCLWYGVARFSTDFLRAYDKTFLGLTAAQYLCVILAPAGLWILLTSRKRERLAEASAEPSSAGGVEIQE